MVSFIQISVAFGSFLMIAVVISIIVVSLWWIFYKRKVRQNLPANILEDLKGGSYDEDENNKKEIGQEGRGSGRPGGSGESRVAGGESKAISQGTGGEDRGSEVLTERQLGVSVQHDSDTTGDPKHVEGTEPDSKAAKRDSKESWPSFE